MWVYVILNSGFNSTDNKTDQSHSMLVIQHQLLSCVGMYTAESCRAMIRCDVLHCAVHPNTAASLQGGMMEEWHQKLHNNTSPDDVVICQALIAYLQHDLDISHYWTTLQVGLCIHLDPTVPHG